MDVFNNNKVIRLLIQWYNETTRRYPPCRYGVYILSSLAILPFITFVSALASSLAAFVMIATAVVGFCQLGALLLFGMLLFPILLVAAIAAGLTAVAVACIWTLVSSSVGEK